MLVGGILVGFIHLMAVVVVVGGSFFVNSVLGKATDTLSPPDAGKLNQAVGETFGKVAWISTILIIVTGLVRAVALELFNPSTLFGSVYGNLLLAKIVLLVVIIVNMVEITRTGLRMAGLSGANSAPDPEAMGAGQKRIKTLSMTNLSLATLAVVFAVAMRFIGAPSA